MKKLFTKTIISEKGKAHNRDTESYLARLEQIADNNYEAYEEYEEYGGAGRGRSARPHARSARQPQRRSSVTGLKFTQKPPARWKSGTQALIDLVVQRVTANINADLPFALFGFTHLASHFLGMLTPPAGLTFTIDTSNPSRIDFVWTDGILTDRVRITTTQNNYIAFLQGLASDMFIVNKIRMTLSNVVDTDQFNRSIELGEKTMFGKRTFNPMPIQSLKSPHQFQTNIVDLGTDEKPLNFGVDKNVVLLSQIKNVALFSVTYSTFISNLERLNRSMI